MNYLLSLSGSCMINSRRRSPYQQDLKNLGLHPLQRSYTLDSTPTPHRTKMGVLSYDTKLHLIGEVLVLWIWRMQSNASLPLGSGAFGSISCDYRINRQHLCRGVSFPSPTIVLGMTLNNLMVMFQWCWSFGECGVPFHCYHSQVNFGPEC